METPQGPAYVPEYNKPDAPGIWMNFDNTVSIYHIVAPDDDFAKAGHDVFALVKEAQERFPDWPRVLFIDITGHDGPQHGFEPDCFEFQREFLFSTVVSFLTGFETPVTGPLVNPEAQRNDLPDTLVIEG